MDSCITKVDNSDLYLIQTTDFFTPLVNDPYLYGRISCCNVLSDLYATGVINCDNVLMLLASSTQFTNDEREVVVPQMIKGFNDCCLEAGTKVRGGHTLVNPWPLIGGVATAVTSKFVVPTNARKGDKIILTKPIGTQIAVNLYQWKDLGEKRFDSMTSEIKLATDKIYRDACYSMGLLNKHGAIAMQKYNATSGTDITGFGILGHAENLAKAQTNTSLKFMIKKLPILKHCLEIDTLCNGMFKLKQGFSAETSGGLLVTISEADCSAFIEYFEQNMGYTPWIVGQVTEAEGFAEIIENVEVDEVQF